MAQWLKNLPANAGDAGDTGQFLGDLLEDTLEKGMAVHLSILTWEIP